MAVLAEEATDKGEAGWQLVLYITLRRAAGSPAERAAAERYYLRVIDVFKKQHGGGEVSVFSPIGGVYVLDSGDFQWTLDEGQIRFDWSGAWPLLYEIETLAEEAREWWPPRPVSEQRGRGMTARIARVLRSAPSSDPHQQDRRPHSMRAYGLATWVLGSIKRENLNHSPSAGGDTPEPSGGFISRIATYRSEMEAARARFRAAAQRTAQSRYWEGALLGAAGLAFLCALVGVVFWLSGTDAAYGIAVPAGGVGAMVSLLQRMSSGRLRLQIDAGRDLLEVFGAVRPFIGAIFGSAVTALLLGGLVPVIQVPPEQQLAFFAGVGFLAGFNERWAQDMLQSSAGQVGGMNGSRRRSAAPDAADFD
jgi:hypothetical protein